MSCSFVCVEPPLTCIHLFIPREYVSLVINNTKVSNVKVMITQDELIGKWEQSCLSSSLQISLRWRSETKTDISGHTWMQQRLTFPPAEGKFKPPLCPAPPRKTINKSSSQSPRLVGPSATDSSTSERRRNIVEKKWWVFEIKLKYEMNPIS